MKLKQLAMGLELIEDWKTHLHRVWSIRLSLAFGVFTGVLMGLPAFVDTLNPLLFMGLAVFFNVVIIPLSRLIKQADYKRDHEAAPVAPAPAPAPPAPAAVPVAPGGAA
jgi:hypothetical protein